jgi:DsbC/DsbD-like thiol-disulfide interchange protein
MARDQSPKKRSFVLAALLVLALFGCAQETSEKKAGVDYGEGHAVSRLIAEVDSLIPGKTFHLGVLFDIEEGWHLYWDGLNDSGLPISIEPSTPPGFTAGDLLWPAPRRLVSPGDILDHVYEDRVTVLVPYHVPEDLEPGGRITFEGRMSWIACREACVPGEASASLTLPVGRPSPGRPDKVKAVSDESGKQQSYFEEARSRIPVPLQAGQPDVDLAWTENTLTIEAGGARELVFYPHAECTNLSNPIEDAARRGDRLQLRFEGAPGEPIRAVGVLEVIVGRGEGAKFYSLDIHRDENGIAP